MLERGSGRIISASPGIGETGSVGQANYAASKSGLLGLTKSLAKGPSSISVARRARWSGAESLPGLGRLSVLPGLTQLGVDAAQVLSERRGELAAT